MPKIYQGCLTTSWQLPDTSYNLDYFTTMYKVDFTLSWKQMPIKLRAYKADRSCAQPKKRSKYWYISLLVPMVLEKRSIWNSQISLSLHHQSWQLQQTYSTAHWLNSGLKGALFGPYYITKRTREILTSNIHLLSPQN